MGEEGDGLIERQADEEIEQSLEARVESIIENKAEESVELERKQSLEGTVESLVEEEVVEPLEQEAEQSLEVPVESSTDNEIENTIEGIVESLAEDEKQKQSIALEVENTVEESVEESVEELAKEVGYKPIKRYKKIFIGIIIIFSAVFAFYFGVTVYFINHFYFGSEINGINVSGKSVQEVEVLMAAELQDYRLNLKQRQGKSEQIEVDDVGLTYSSDEEFKKLKESQNPFGWILAGFNSKDFKMTVDIIYDEKLLKQRIDRLHCFERKHIIESKNASFQYVGDTYMIVDEVPGNKVDKAILYAHVAEALLVKQVEIDLEAINAYIEPRYHSSSQEIIKVQDTLNKYVASKITYTFANSEEVLDGVTIHEWLTVNENLEVVVDEKKVENYIDILSEKYNTIGSIRNFMTSSGETIEVSGGDFSKPINKAVETQNLISAIKEGLTIIKEPVYGEAITSYGNSDIGDTYVEIDLTNQHIWFYKNGALIVEGDIVTGNVRAGHTTPKGVYSLKYKVKNAVLRGPGYAAPVSFWMPFNGGIGIHDANWRSRFGGEIYKTDGSHGCINCPKNVASEIYHHIEPNTPVICY